MARRCFGCQSTGGLGHHCLHPPQRLGTAQCLGRRLGIHTARVSPGLRPTSKGVVVDARSTRQLRAPQSAVLKRIQQLLALLARDRDASKSPRLGLAKRHA